jgi:hypothetical protein
MVEFLSREKKKDSTEAYCQAVEIGPAFRRRPVITLSRLYLKLMIDGKVSRPIQWGNNGDELRCLNCLP